MAIVVPVQIADVFSTIDTVDDARKFLRGDDLQSDFTDAGGVEPRPARRAARHPRGRR